MNTIKMLFHIDATMDKVYDALSTIEGLKGWWTTEVSGDEEPGGMLSFSFGAHKLTLAVKECIRPNKVVWAGTSEMPDWDGTIISFNMDENEGKTRIRFSHEGFKEANDGYASTTTGWARYLGSLRQYCQTGTGEAFGSPTFRK